MFRMSRLFGALYVKSLAPLSAHAPQVGPEWVAYRFDEDLFPDEVNQDADPDICASAELSRQFGEAIYVFSDEGNDQLYYDHCRDGALVRKVMYVFDGCQSAWTCVAGTPEAWEDGLFSDQALARELDLCEPEDRDRVRAVFARRILEVGSIIPRASSSHLIEAHFGITRPELPRRRR